MTELTDRLRDHNRSEYGICNEAANEIERLTRELANARAIDIHSCHEGCTRAGCVAAGLREQLALAETVRASQVEGLTQGLDALRENGQRLLEIANSAVQHQQDMVDAATAPLHTLISALRVELHCLREQMERQKDEWLSWDGKRRALEQDAERYRWLRDKARTVDWTEDVNGWSWEQHCRIGARSMDAAIDAARKTGP